MTSCGFSPRRSSYEQPQFAMTPAPKFSRTTSLTAARRRNTARPSSWPISIATPSMPRENDAYIGVIVAPDGSTASVGRR